MDSPIFKRLQIYHNYCRSHMGIENKTPSDKAEIVIAGDDKWKNAYSKCINIKKSSHGRTLMSSNPIHCAIIYELNVFHPTTLYYF